MSNTGGPGQGLTFSLSVDTVISRLRNIQLPDISTEAVDFTGLSDIEWFQYLFATLKDGGVLVAECFFNTEIQRPSPGVVQTATVTFAKQNPGSTSNATLTGTGAVVSNGLPAGGTGEPMIESIAFRFDGGINGGTPLTFSPES